MSIPPSAPSELSQRAFELATGAITKIDMHMEQCEKRQTEILARLQDGAAERGKLRQDVVRIVVRALTAIITIQMAALGYFLAKFGLPGLAH